MKQMPLIIFLFLSACTKDLTDFSPAPESFQEAMLEQVNAMRKTGWNCGGKEMSPVVPLQWSTKLEQAAYLHAEDMNSYDFFEHQGTDGSMVGNRVEDAGYNWAAVGENIAWGYYSIEEAMKAWKDSPGHCQMIMNPDFTEMGASQKGAYWVQTFADPAN